MKCLLHIGTEKTGTTLLQDWLYANQEQFSKQGIFLSNYLENPNRKIVSYFKKDLDDWAWARKISSPKEKEEFLADFEQKFTEEIYQASKKHSVAIITSEHFHSRLRTQEEILKLKNYLLKTFESVKIICYFREQSAMAISTYSTVLRGSDCFDSLNCFLEKVTPNDYYFNHLEIAKNWSDAFGKENCDFRIYDTETITDLRLDFLTSIDKSIDLKDFDWSTKSSNSSLTKLEAELYRLTNEKIPHWNKEKTGLNQKNIDIKKRLSSIIRLKHGKLKSTEATNISKRFFESNTEFFNKYFNGNYLFPKDKENTPQDSDKIFTLFEVTEIVSDILSAFVFKEPQTENNVNVQLVKDLYEVLLLRTAEEMAIRDKAGRLQSGAAMPKDIIREIIRSSEFKSKLGYFLISLEPKEGLK